MTAEFEVTTSEISFRDEKPHWLTTTNQPMEIVNGKGEFSELCIVDFNADIESGICSTAVDYETGKCDKSKLCEYCYAARLFKNDKFAFKTKQISESTFKKLKEKLPEFSTLRIGKNFECGAPITREKLLEVLELCVKYKVRPIVVSKVLEYDERVADLLIKSDGTLHISLGNDELEKGAVEHSADFWTRVARAIDYKKVGVNTYVRVVADITMPMSDDIKKVYVYDVPILLTPLYYLKKDLFTRSDMTWDEAKTNGTYYWNHGLHPKVIHPDWDKVKERCGYIDGKMWCNNCGLKKIFYSEEAQFSKTKYKEKLKKAGWNK